MDVGNAKCRARAKRSILNDSQMAIAPLLTVKATKTGSVKQQWLYHNGSISMFHF